jgi:benzoyl-CoA reductase/2-hydroxyglutaryl-CoA dehydratase subunit BcrC/BadD/HgdB
MRIFDAAFAGRWDGSAIGSHAGAAGKDIIGFLDTGFPEEIAIAAGLVPILLTADPYGDCPATEGKVDLGIPGRARQLYEGLLTGRYSFASAVAITGGDRYLANTYGFLDAQRELTGTAAVDKMFYIERARGTYREHRDFNLQRHQMFRDSLAAHTGRKIDDDALAAAIALVNESRRLLQRLADLRMSRPGIVSGTNAAKIALASMLMPKEDFNAALRGFLEQLPQDVAATELPTIFLAGSPLDHFAIHEAIEAAGTLVVWENVEFSGRYEHDLIREDIDPMEAIADRYTFKFPDAWAFGRDRRIASHVKTARKSGADAVLFFHTLYDASTGWDYPDLRDALNALDIKTRVLHDQTYQIADRPQLASRIADAVAGIRKRAQPPTP